MNDAPNFQKQKAKGLLEKPLATARLKLDSGDNAFFGFFCHNEEHDKATYRFALHETQERSPWYYTWSHSFSPIVRSSQKRCEQNKCPSQFALTGDTVTYHLKNENKLSLAWSSVRVEHNKYLNSAEKITERASLLISNSMSLLFDKKVAVGVTYTTESIYLITLMTQIAEFSVS